MRSFFRSFLFERTPCNAAWQDIIHRRIEHKQKRQEYLTQKREAAYGEFVEMIYKLQQNVKNGSTYTQKEMMDDLSKFSKKITLWGSTKVVNKWGQFRENGANPETAEKKIYSY